MARIGIGRRATLCAVTLFAAALVSAGCANANRVASGGSPTSVPQTGGTSAKGAPPAPSGGGIGAGSTSLLLARADAFRLMSGFHAPSGAQSIGAAPSGVSALTTIANPGAANVVDSTTWWRVTGNVTAVLAAIASSPPTGATTAGRPSASGPGGSVHSLTFEFPTTTTLLGRELRISAVQSGGNVVLRVDALVTYAAVHPVSGAVPPGSTAIVVSMVRQTLVAVTDGDVFGPVTINDAGQVARVAALINAGKPQLPVLLHCPMSGPGSMSIEFLTKVGGQRLSTAVISTSGCAGALVRPVTGGIVRLAGGADLVRQIEGILGLNWPKPTG
jgi:hypothetical protein